MATKRVSKTPTTAPSQVAATVVPTNNSAPLTAKSLQASTFAANMGLPIGSNGLFDFARFGYGPNATGAIDIRQKMQMLLDPQISAALWLRRAAILYDDPVIAPCVPRDDSRYKAAVKNADLCRFSLQNIDGGLTAALAQSLEADWWRNTCADVVWEEKTYNGKQVLVPGVFDTFAAGAYVLWRQNGRIIGVQPLLGNNGLALTGETQIIDAKKYLIHIFRPSPRGQWDGTDLARVVWTPFYMKNRGHPENLKYMGLFSNPSLVGTAPEDAPESVPLLGQDGKPVLDPVTGEALTISPQGAMSEGLRLFGGAGSYTVIPPKAKLALMEAQGDGRIFINFEDARDWQILTGILGTGNMTARAKYGSNASAQTGQAAVEAPTLLDGMALGAQLRKICATIVEVNAPKKDWDLVPMVRINPANRSFYETLFAAILANSPFADDRLIDGIAERLGAPKPDFEKLAEMAAQKQAAAEMAASAPPTSAPTAKPASGAKP